MQVARIKIGATVFSDRAFPIWGEHIGVGQEDRMFEFMPLDVQYNRYELRAWGFGIHTDQYGEGAYGNGPLFVHIDDVIISDEDAWDTIYKPMVKINKQLKPGYYMVVDGVYKSVVEVDRNNNVWRIGHECEISMEEFNTLTMKWVPINNNVVWKLWPKGDKIMGCPDYVRVACPMCKEQITFQSKAGQCSCLDFSLDSVPVSIATDLDGEQKVCSNCDTTVTLVVSKAPIARVRMEVVWK